MLICRGDPYKVLWRRNLNGGFMPSAGLLLVESSISSLISILYGAPSGLYPLRGGYYWGLHPQPPALLVVVGVGAWLIVVTGEESPDPSSLGNLFY